MSTARAQRFIDINYVTKNMLTNSMLGDIIKMIIVLIISRRAYE